MRVITHEAASRPPEPWRPLGFDVINVVHADFFPTFVERHLLPFFESSRGGYASSRTRS